MSELPSSHIDHDTVLRSRQRLTDFGGRILGRLTRRSSEVSDTVSESDAADVVKSLEAFNTVLMGTERSTELMQALNSAPGVLKGEEFITSFGSRDGEDLGMFEFNPAIYGMPEDEALRRPYWTLDLNVDKFINAPHFADWNGRAADDPKNGSSSHKLVKSYSKKPGNTAPPISHVNMYIQPDGQTFFELVGDGAHRLAAAKKRGDSRIRATGSIGIMRLRENSISDQLEHMQIQ